MSDDKQDKADPPKDTDALGEIVSKLGGLMGHVTDLIETAKTLRDSDGDGPAGKKASVSEARVSITTVDGDPVSFSSLKDAFTGDRPSRKTDDGPMRPLREATLEFVVDTPQRLVAVADLPGVTTENVTVVVDGDRLTLKTEGGAAEYWAETLLPRDVAGASQEVAVINGILAIEWRLSGEAV